MPMRKRTRNNIRPGMLFWLEMMNLNYLQDNLTFTEKH